MKLLENAYRQNLDKFTSIEGHEFNHMSRMSSLESDCDLVLVSRQLTQQSQDKNIAMKSLSKLPTPNDRYGSMVNDNLMRNRLHIPQKGIADSKELMRKVKSKQSITRNQSKYIHKFETSMNLGSGISIVD